MIHIEIEDEYDSPPRREALQAAAQAALQQQAQDQQSEISILLTSAEALRQLNRRHRQVDETTDVLSFPSGERDPESGATYLGDIAIAFPVAERQAAQGGHPVEAELQLLAVHGVLHLLGHDHGGAQEQARMWAAQRQILDSLGLEIGWEHAAQEHD